MNKIYQSLSKGVLTVLITSVVYKYFHPSQDVRYHHVDKYVSLVEVDRAIKYEHKIRWNEIFNEVMVGGIILGE
ncbi:hypothetical protein [Candidatus Tisiphia endosymbiont of Ptychoptera albimana]|uniref:hypothetical protein n=1 Tax=Candidatus Tisiphia endosymbiont of Ptychoptera albimana TaxID=3066260 RepID=UPI00312CA7B7